MSLINEALKKAQSQRTNSPGTPPTGAVPPTAVSGNPGDSSKPSPFGKAGVLIALCAVIVSLSVVTTVFLLRGNSNSSATTAANSRTEPKSSETIVPMAIVPHAAPAPVNSGALPLTLTANLTEATGVAKTTPVATAATPGMAANPPATTVALPNAQVAAAAPVPTVAPEPTPVKVTVRIQAMVDKFRISGMRLSDTDSKVILNDHLFRVDDPVESSIGLRLTKIEEHRLTFVDGDGNIYVKRL